MTEPTQVSGLPANRNDVSPATYDLAELLRQFGGKVAGYLSRRFPGLDDDERHDVLVDALVAFTRTYREERGPAGPWLLLLAHQRAIDLLRVAPATPGMPGWLPPEQLGVTDSRPSRRLEYQEQLETVQAAVARLAPMERAVIEADLDAGSAANARRLARQLETTERSVYAARARAREKLAEWLKIE